MRVFTENMSLDVRLQDLRVKALRSRGLNNPIDPFGVRLQAWNPVKCSCI